MGIPHGRPAVGGRYPVHLYASWAGSRARETHALSVVTYPSATELYGRVKAITRRSLETLTVRHGNRYRRLVRVLAIDFARRCVSEFAYRPLDRRKLADCDSA